jgi:hypothetical protein
MQKLSVRKLSLLGLVLMAASAVTAAILPKNEPKAFNGVQTASTALNLSGQVTCVNIPGTKNCTFTANSGTSAAGDTSSGGTNTGGTLNSSASPN